MMPEEGKKVARGRTGGGGGNPHEEEIVERTGELGRAWV